MTNNNCSQKPFDFLSFILAKKQGLVHCQAEIATFVQLVKTNQIPDYQISAWLMAVAIKGLNYNETYYLTKAMLNSGQQYDFQNQNQPVIDKHSTGGVGDSTSLIIAPILAACGISVAKLSGKGLGFSGGTIDKLNAIGMSTKYSYHDAYQKLAKEQILIIEQSADIAPVDKIFYALRDVTGTVDSLPLVAASVMSKKLAFLTNYLFLDVKYGSGAFCRNLKTAQQLAAIMKKIANQAKINCHIFISNMDQPLGTVVGNLLELKQVHNFLNNQPTTPQLTQLITTICCQVLMKIKGLTYDAANQQYQQVLSSGAAFKLMTKWLKENGVDEHLWITNQFFAPPYQLELFADKDGYWQITNNAIIGQVAVELGVGRKKKSDLIDKHAGIEINFRINDYVTKGQKIATLYSSKAISKYCSNHLLTAFNIADQPTTLSPMVINYHE